MIITVNVSYNFSLIQFVLSNNKLIKRPTSLTFRLIRPALILASLMRELTRFRCSLNSCQADCSSEDFAFKYKVFFFLTSAKSSSVIHDCKKQQKPCMYVCNLNINPTYNVRVKIRSTSYLKLFCFKKINDNYIVNIVAIYYFIINI